MSEKKFNVAMIGCGVISKYHLNGLQKKPECVLYAVCDNRTDGRLQERKEEFGAQIAVSDYKELVNDPNVDIAIVTTPDNTHLEIATAFLRGGKDVLLEKPMALTVEECEEMMRVEKETGRRLMVGQVARYSGNAPRAKKMVEEGVIGELVYVETEYAHDYIRSRGYNDWRVSPEREGMIGGGGHAVDMLRWIAGNPTEVFAYSNHKFLTDWPVNDSTIAVYKFPNDVIGKVFCSIGAKRAHDSRTTLFGTKGTLCYSSKGTEMQLYQVDEEGKGYTEPHIIPCQPADHNMAGEISDFIDAIIEGRPNPIPSMEGASTIAACRATVESAKLGMPVQIKYPEL